MRVGGKEARVNYPLSVWASYKLFIEKRTAGNAFVGPKNMLYWQEKLFTDFVTYVLPISLIALLPGVYLGFKLGYYFIAISDLVVAVCIPLIVLNTRFNYTFRKFFFIFNFYVLSIVLLFGLGTFGPGSIFLIAVSTLTSLFFQKRYANWSIGMNFLICITGVMIIYFRPFNVPLTENYDLGSWIAISSNLIFLSWIIKLLLIRMINGLNNTITSEHFLKISLEKSGEENCTANALLKESEEHYKSLFVLNPSPMWVLDSESLYFLQVNESAVRNYGYTNEEFLSMTINDIKRPEDAEATHDDILRNRQKGIPFTRLTEHLRKNQEWFFVEVIFNTIPFRGKSGILAIAEDISDEVEYIRAIETQNNKLREIAWIQSHKVRSPVATILGLAGLLNHSLTADEITEIIEGLVFSTRKLDEVIKETTGNTSAYQITNDFPDRIVKLLPDTFNKSIQD